MIKNIIASCFLVFSFTLQARSTPKFIDVELNKTGFRPGEKAVLTVFKLANPSSTSLKISVEAELTAPDSSKTMIGLKEITDEVVMAMTSAFSQTGGYKLKVSAYLEEPGVILPLKQFIEENHARICVIDSLLESETETEERIALQDEKNERLADIELAKIQIAFNRELLQEETLDFSVSGNLPPKIQLASWPAHISKLFAQIEEISGNVVTVILCANLPVRDPEDGSKYNWNVNFGDGNEVTFKNNSYRPDNFQDHGCIEHTYFDNLRPTVTYTAIDKEGASFSLSQTFDFRKNVPRPIPNIKLKSVAKVTTADANGNSIPGIKVVLDPFGTRVPSDTGIYLYRFFPQGRCGDLLRCPDFYNQQKPLKDLEFIYKFAGTYYMQFLVKDNLQFTETSRAPVNINFDNFPTNPSQSYIDAAFGPAAIMQADRNNVNITDLNKGVEIKFDGSSSFDVSGDNSKLTYYWDFGDPFSGNNFSRSKKATHVYKNPGHYYAFLFVRDEHGNESIDDWMHVHVTHDSLQEASLQFFAYRSSNNPQEIMFSTLELIRLGATANEQFYWDYGDGTQDSTSHRPTVKKTYSQPGIYNVSVTFQNVNGQFVKLTKTIDTATTLTAPGLANGIVFNPGLFGTVGETEVTVEALPLDNTQDLSYWWNFDEAKFFSGGVEEAIKTMVFNAVGVKHVILNLTNESEFSSEFRNLYAVGNRELKLSQYEITKIGEQTKVDFTVSVPSDHQDIKRIEIFNFERGWEIIENPSSTSGSVTIYGTGTVTIVVTDNNGNKNAFVKKFQQNSRVHEFPVSDSFMNQAASINKYREHIIEQIGM